MGVDDHANAAVTKFAAALLSLSDLPAAREACRTGLDLDPDKKALAFAEFKEDCIAANFQTV